MRIYIITLPVSEFGNEMAILRDVPTNAPMRYAHQGQDLENIELHFEVGDNERSKFTATAFVVIPNGGSRDMDACHDPGFHERSGTERSRNVLSYVGSCEYVRDGDVATAVAHVYQRV